MPKILSIHEYMKPYIMCVRLCACVCVCVSVCEIAVLNAYFSAAVIIV